MIRTNWGQAMVDRLTNLISIFQKPELDFSKNWAEHDDILGDAYEYLMRYFATQSGKSKGQFYTPSEVSRVIAKVIGISPQNAVASTTALWIGFAAVEGCSGGRETHHPGGPGEGCHHGRSGRDEHDSMPKQPRPERVTQNRVISLFTDQNHLGCLGYRYLVDWHHPKNNDFSLAEEVTLKGGYERRPDIVVYLNGIAVAVIELKRSSMEVADGGRQLITNQEEIFNQSFFS